MRGWRQGWLFGAVVLGGVGCHGAVEPADSPMPDRCGFERDVYPVLLRDCGFPACHGTPDRFFQLYGPGRTRLDPQTGPFEEPTRDELDRSFDRSRSMLAGSAAPEGSLLLRKPLDGNAHVGTDQTGHNVYADREQAEWQTLRRWAHGELPPCE